jgi:hypothetical protein
LWGCFCQDMYKEELDGRGRKEGKRKRKKKEREKERN